MSDDEKEGPKSSVSERNWILWLTAVVLGAFLIFEFINFLGESDEAAASDPPPAASVAMPAAAVADSAAPGVSAAPAVSAKAP